MNKEGKIEINKLKPHPMNNYYFDDMSGDAWDDLLKSITTSGITNAITITQDAVIISGHQRVRACKVLGIDEISYKMIEYGPDDDQKQIKDLIESNLKQRVAVNPNPVKLGRCFKFLNDYYGFEHGGSRKSGKRIANLKDVNAPLTQKDLSKSYGISQQTMNNYIRLTRLIPKLGDLVQADIVSKDTARYVMNNLTEQEQELLITSLDTTKRITKKKIQEYVSIILNSKENYHCDIQKYKIGNERTSKEFKSQELQKTRNKLNDIRSMSPEIQRIDDLRDSVIIFCEKCNNFIEDIRRYTWLSDYIDEIPENDRNCYLKAINEIKSWVYAMNI